MKAYNYAAVTPRREAASRAFKYRELLATSFILMSLSILIDMLRSLSTGKSSKEYAKARESSTDRPFDGPRIFRNLAGRNGRERKDSWGNVSANARSRGGRIV